MINLNNHLLKPKQRNAQLKSTRQPYKILALKWPWRNISHKRMTRKTVLEWHILLHTLYNKTELTLVTMRLSINLSPTKVAKTLWNCYLIAQYQWNHSGPTICTRLTAARITIELHRHLHHPHTLTAIWLAGLCGNVRPTNVLRLMQIVVASQNTTRTLVKGMFHPQTCTKCMDPSAI